MSVRLFIVVISTSRILLSFRTVRLNIFMSMNVMRTSYSVVWLSSR